MTSRLAHTKFQAGLVCIVYLIHVVRIGQLGCDQATDNKTHDERVGSWNYSSSDSIVSLVIYTSLVILNLIAIQIEKYRVIAAGLSRLGHVGLGTLHVYRLMRPFTFEVFGYSWSQVTSLREALIVLPFGVLSLIIAGAYSRAKRYPELI